LTGKQQAMSNKQAISKCAANSGQRAAKTGALIRLLPLGSPVNNKPGMEKFSISHTIIGIN
jgi:hypothetical protein